MYKKYFVRLTEEQRGQLESLLVRRGRAHARKLLYARILLSRPTRMVPTDGPTRGSPRLWRSAPPRWRVKGDAFAKTGSKWR